MDHKRPDIKLFILTFSLFIWHGQGLFECQYQIVHTHLKGLGLDTLGTYLHTPIQG